MRKVLYTKYNSTRVPAYQVSTSIIQADAKKIVEKKAMQLVAREHLEQIQKNRELLADLYTDIELIPCEQVGDGLVFPFVAGKSILDDIDFRADDINRIVEKIKTYFLKINKYNPEYVSEFVMTEDFAHLFEGCQPKKEMATSITNVDAIFGNFVEDEDGKVWCIDYEWVLNFPVPIRYIEYRNLLYIYTEHVQQLASRICLEDFFRLFEYDEEDIRLFGNMEEKFQEKVHGKNRKYIYTEKYKKTNKKMVDIFEDVNRLPVVEKEVELTRNHANNLQGMVDVLNKRVDEKDSIICEINDHADDLNNRLNELNGVMNQKDTIISSQNDHVNDLYRQLEEQQDYILRMKKAIKNPFYGLNWLMQRTKRKLEEEKVQREERKECVGTIDKTEFYREKYANLISPENQKYEEWISALENSETYDETFAYTPKISVIVPVYNVLDKHLIPCIESVLNQVYENWELCLADDNSTWDNVKTTLAEYETNERIKIVYRKENGHISRCTNSALEIATGEFVAFMDCDDLLRPNALYEVVKKLNEDPDLDFIYSDEDKVDDDGKNRHMPHFKPDWSPDTLMSHMYTCHFGVYRRSIVEEIGGLRTGVEGAQDYDFTLRFTEKTDKIAHIDKILYHWRERKESTAINPAAKPYILEAAKNAKLDALKRRGLSAELELVDTMYQFRVNYISKKNPLVSIVIPSKDNFDILERCIRTLTSITEYKNYEIILVDNGSNADNHTKYMNLSKEYDIHYIYEPMDFNFSRMCNIGASAAKGDYFLFLNDDIEIVEKEWLTRMVGHAELSHVGAVGAKLLYPENKKIQHIGVLEIFNGPVHAFSGYSDENIYYFGRNRIDYNWLAVTAACLLVDKEKFYEVGGFDEELAVAYNDVDFCFKLVEAGYYNVVRNDVVLYHHESISRGNDLIDEAKLKRLMNEQKKLYKKHPNFNKKDPFYNKNLTQYDVNFDYNYNNRAIKWNQVSEFDGRISTDADLHLSIDCLENTDFVKITGWAYVDGREDNNDANVSLLLKSDSAQYVIDTQKVYRPDVAQAFPEQKYIEFVGFSCDFKKDTLLAGKYELYVMCNGRCQNTGGIVEI